jgi:hypothetical protein
MLVAGSSAQAQDTLSEDIENMFFKMIRTNHEESYITFSQGIGNVEPLIFEALAAPHFLIRTKTQGKWGATLSPMILIRMFAEESFPVKSPSYMPQITFYRQLDYLPREKVSYLFFKLAHHSNGQQADFFNEDGSLNKLNGDFATNFIELGAFFNKKFIQTDHSGEYFKTSFEYHINYHRSEELAGIYSFFRWHNDFRLFHIPNNRELNKLNTNPKFQTTLKTTWLFGDINNASSFNLKERLNVSLTLNYHPDVLKDISLFIDLYSGEDYYNMQFDRRIQVLRFGIQAYTFK